MNKEKLKKIYTEKFIDILFLNFIILTICFLGAGLNNIVIQNNNFKMPVSIDSYNLFSDFKISYIEDETHFSFKKLNDVKFPIFSDLIPTPIAIYSIGDFLMFGSIFLWIVLFIYQICLLKEYYKKIWK